MGELNYLFLSELSIYYTGFLKVLKANRYNTVFDIVIFMIKYLLRDVE